ncbi:hypothetical protein ACOME3_010261 [Neoechinorhynchus agilis]
MPFNTHDIQPECLNDFIDVYVELDQWTDVLSNQSLATNGRLGRFCRRVSPVHLVSVKNVLVLAFLSRDLITESGFNGTYEFVDTPLYPLATSDKKCEFVYKDVPITGYVQPPLYPGQYLPNTVCIFRLVALTRVKLTLLKIGISDRDCGFDRISIYDVTKSGTFLQRTYCGNDEQVSHSPPVFFSTERELVIEFVTKTFTMNSNRFGFKGHYVLGTAESGFLPVDPSVQKGLVHLRGTHCDYEVIDGGEKGQRITLSSSRSKPRHLAYNCTVSLLPGRRTRISLRRQHLQGCRSDAPEQYTKFYFGKGRIEVIVHVRLR